MGLSKASRSSSTSRWITHRTTSNRLKFRCATDRVYPERLKIAYKLKRFCW